MRPYEMTFVLRLQSTDDEFKQVVDQVIGWIEQDDNGKVNKVDLNSLGRRRLAYEIDKQREGHYVIMEANIAPSHLNELELNLKLSADVLRYLIIHADGNDA